MLTANDLLPRREQAIKTQDAKDAKDREEYLNQAMCHVNGILSAIEKGLAEITDNDLIAQRCYINLSRRQFNAIQYEEVHSYVSGCLAARGFHLESLDNIRSKTPLDDNYTIRVSFGSDDKEQNQPAKKKGFIESIFGK